VSKSFGNEVFLDMTAQSTTPIPDPQSSNDTRGIHLDRVGINRVHYPVLIAGWNADVHIEEVKDTKLSLTVSLGSNKRGIHMSRLLEAVHQWDQALSPQTLPDFLNKIREQQGAEVASVDCDFIWFYARSSPKTAKPAWQGIQTIWHGEQTEKYTTVGYTLNIPVTTLCPCSKEISDYGAHSQRGWVKVKLQWQNLENLIAPQEIFEKLQHAGSAPIYPLLKRADERHVTMLAYEQPAFVEDTTRNAAQCLQSDIRIESFQLDICNEESIHTHNAIASLSFTRNL